MLRVHSTAQRQIAFILVVPRAPKSLSRPRLSKDLNASRRPEPKLQRELPQQVFDHIHARREAGQPYRYTTKDVRAILKFVNDKPEPARPSFFTEADQARFDETRRTSRQLGERIAAERTLSLADRIEKPRLAERISAGTNAAPTTKSPIIDFENKSNDRIIAIFIPKIRATLRRLAIVVKLERFELLPNDLRLPIKDFVDRLDKFYNSISTRPIDKAQWQALNYGLLEIGNISFKSIRQRHDEIALEIARVLKGNYFNVLEDVV